MPGSTAVFQLVLHRFSLFQNGLVGVSTATDAMKIDFRSGTDSYDSRYGTYGRVGDVVTNGSVQVGGWAVVDGNAKATSSSVCRSAKITGQTTIQKSRWCGFIVGGVKACRTMAPTQRCAHG